MPILTLTTDIGHHDYLVGAIKGQLLTLDPLFNINDITHHLSQSNYPQAAYVCSNAFRHYPAHTFHIILLNIFETQSGQFLVAKYNDQYIACPDNGILTMITENKPKEIIALKISGRQTLLEITGQVAEAASLLAKGRSLSSIGDPADAIVEKNRLRPTSGNNWIEGQVLFIDNFENVIINITRHEFEEHRKGRSFRIVFIRNEVIDVISTNYAAANEGEKLAWFNSAGYLEIAINKGNIAGLFGLQGYNEKMHRPKASLQNKWFYQTVRVLFE